MSGSLPAPARRPGRRLTVHCDTRDHSGRASLVTELLQRARRAGLAGATVFEAVAGFGASGRTHRTHLLSDDAPVTFVVVDTPERIDAFVEDVADLLTGVLVSIADVEIVGPGTPR
ncbi:MAG: DUF190 domain-containing protein [Actinomycetota bacterium]|nr:DUF190 domain-containing protein [Actinomycetota bacterium]